MTCVSLMTWMALSGVPDERSAFPFSPEEEFFTEDADALGVEEALPVSLGQGVPAGRRKDRKVGFSIGLMVTRETGDLESRGVGALFEMRFRATPELWIGFRLEAAGMQSAKLDGPGDEVEFDQYAITAITAKATYFFLEGPVRPYAAFGAGFYWWGSQSASSDSGTFKARQEAGGGLGVAPGIGIDVSIVRIGFTYNLIFAESKVEVSIGPSEDVRRDYWALEISASF